MRLNNTTSKIRAWFNWRNEKKKKKFLIYLFFFLFFAEFIHFAHLKIKKLISTKKKNVLVYFLGGFCFVSIFFLSFLFFVFFALGIQTNKCSCCYCWFFCHNNHENAIFLMKFHNIIIIYLKFPQYISIISL